MLELGPVKVNIIFYITLKKEMPIAETTNFYFQHANPFTLVTFNPTTVGEKVDEAVDFVRAKVDGWTKNGSGWVIQSVNNVYVDVNKYDPLKGGGYIPLPSSLQKKRAIINIKNRDNQCLRYVMRAH